MAQDGSLIRTGLVTNLPYNGNPRPCKEAPRSPAARPLRAGFADGTGLSGSLPSGKTEGEMGAYPIDNGPLGVCLVIELRISRLCAGLSRARGAGGVG